MPDTSKQVRISKAIKEINIKLDRAVEFLESKGVEVEKNPNAKISQDAYQLLLDGFQSERAAKAEAKAKKVNRLEKKKTITLDDQEKDDVSDDDEDDSFDPQEILTIKNTGVEPILPQAKVEETPAAPVEEPKAEQPAVEQPKAEEVKPVEQPKEESKPILEVESGDKKVKVLDKIDLDSLNLKTRPDKKSKKPEAKPAPQAKQDEQKPQVAKQSEEQLAPQQKPAAEEVKDTPKASEKSSESKVEATPPAASSEDSGVIETKFQKLEGPTVVGKIDMSQFEKKKKPVASSTEDKRKQAAAGDKNKKKRKRIQKPGAPGDNNNAGGNNQQNRQGGGGNNRFDKNKGRGPKKPEPKKELTEEEIQNQIRETLARLSGGGSKSKSAKYRRAKRDAVSQLKEKELEQQEQEKNKLKVTEFVTVSDLANMMSVSATEVISACMSLGLFVSINQRLDAETLQIVAEEFGYETEFVSAEISSNVDEEVEDESLLLDRAPIVTVMGHVDHGKTSLLDYIRRENVIAGEAGGITQHIGAYVVELENGKKITFLDTPGHEAFTAMRARGAQVTDVAIIVIAADDSVMPQTREAINHAQAAGVPMVFAFNKVDKPGANADKIREELAQMNILVEDWGGKYQCQEISAKKGMGIEELLDKVLLEAELLELKANPNKNAVGTIIESSLDKGRGYVSSLLVQAGTLKIGDVLLAGQFSGRVKAMFNERGGKVTEAGPSTPVSILGLNGASAAGDKFNVFDDEREAKEISLKRQQLQREQGIRTQKHITLDEIGRRLAVGDFKELNIIVKGDVDGSVEALSDSLLKLSTEKIQVNIIHKSVGQISESDVLLASASDAIIVGFQVRPSASARKLAEQEQIDIRMYSVIYKAIEEVKDAMEGMLAPKVVEKVIGNIEIREVFKITKIGNVAGCYVLDGKVNRNSSIRLIRDGIVIYNGEFGSLKRFKDDVKEVSAGYECGLNIKNFNDIKEGDIIEAYEEVEVQQKL